MSVKIMNYRIILFACVAAFGAGITDAFAQDSKALRTNTWSAYAQAGTSWATGLDYKNINQTKGTSIAPEFGLGINYNLRPWVRFGLNWEISKYRREQRFAEFQPLPPSFGNPDEGFSDLTSSYGGLAYRKIWTRYNNLDVTAEFNIMEFWPERKCPWFNLYAGLGAGVMFAKGNTYTLGMGTEHWTDPGNYDQNDNAVGDNWSSTAWVRANNNHHSFNAFYVPALLSAEFDVSPRVTLGVKGEYKAVVSNNDFAPKGIETMAVVFRYNILGRKHGVSSNKRKYEDAMASYSTLKKDYEALQADCAENAEKARKSIDRLNAENNALKRSLQDCQNDKSAENEKVIVLFGYGMSKVSDKDVQQLAELARNMESHENVTISLVGEASADGGRAENQRLSEKRLKNVMDILNEHGVEGKRIRSSKAIGDTNRVFNASNRRVEIVVHK